MESNSMTSLVPQVASSLCSRCEILELDSILTWKGKSYFLDLGRLKRSMPCPLCRLFGHIMPDNQPPHAENQFSLCVVSSLDLFCHKYYHPKGRKLKPGPVDGVLLGVVPSNLVPKGRQRYGPRDALREFNAMKNTGFLAEANSQPIEGQFTPRVLDEEHVDVDFIQDTLEFCKQHHTSSCNIKVPASMTWIRLIDCEAMTIAPAEPDQEYLALSYVWGKQAGLIPRISTLLNEKYTDQSNLLAGNLPNVIEDAIKITRSLGYRYLWIDRYCIPKEEDAEMHSQIAKMDMIYAHATGTIVAGAGNDTDYGLPGVGLVPRRLQPSGRVGDAVLVSTLPGVRKALESSKWISRGWTYQEAILSRRLLVFTQHQVYFECRGMHCCEAVTKPLSFLHTKDMQRLRSGGEFRLFPHNGLGEAHWDIATRILEYSSRELSLDSDALDAVLGIFRSFSFMEPQLHHYWGVPIITSIEDRWGNTREFLAAFAIGLCWSHTRPAKRSLGFPSWSWTGWRGLFDPSTRDRYRIRSLAPFVPQLRDNTSSHRLQYSEDFVMGEDMLQIWVELLDGSLLEWQETEPELFRRLNYPNISPYIHLEGYTVSMTFKWFINGPPGFQLESQLNFEETPKLWAIFDTVDEKAGLKQEDVVTRTGYAPFALSKNAFEDVTFYNKLALESWEGMILSDREFTYAHYERITEYCRFLLVYENDRNTAERVGTVDLRDSWVEYTNSSGKQRLKAVSSPFVQQTRMRIRLG